ncbi:D-alanyl-D-alanine carboxypeptidase [Promicromonospora thailandica]|uniref:D-alanyl-D-alanine carboxypeptidase n=1 Tax=Promicromonospora thailandica TaxID=765201 RepID=A0A9X2K0V6_9MICO|nr:D-alanyl-D-alanine carboxypeptidase [Promicromonospora thailandica]
MRLSVAVTVVAVLTLGGGASAWYVLSSADDLADQTAAARQLLTASDGKVEDSSTRVALTAQIDAADAFLAEPLLTRVLTGNEETAEALTAATDDVRTAMVEFARTQVEQARAGLGAAEARALKYYEATEGLGADEGVRARLQGAIDSTANAGTAADQSLAGTDLAALERAARDLSTSRSVITLATDTLAEAQDAVTCPEDDQTWHPDSGKVPESDLAPIPWDPGFRIRADVLESFVALDAAYQAEFGVHLTINSAYRTYEEQTELYDPSSPIAAAPGCSNHGLGLAVDIGGGVQTFDTPQYTWLKQNAGAHGWTHPDFAEPDGRVPEPWHWESELARPES